MYGAVSRHQDERQAGDPADPVCPEVAEDHRVRGDYKVAREQHEAILAAARRRGDQRRVVSMLVGLAQIDRNTGDLDAAWRGFDEACALAEFDDDQRGRAWALRGLADLVSLHGEHVDALFWLSRAEKVCRFLQLSDLLAYNRKMRGNVLYRAGWYSEALLTYDDAAHRFEGLGDRRGSALTRLGILRCRHKLERPIAETSRDLAELRDSLGGERLRRTRSMVCDALDEVARDAE